MELIPHTDILFFIVAIFFGLGLISFLFGTMILLSKTMNKDIRNLQVHTSKMMRKGITDDISGLVGNANALLVSLQTMVKSAQGIGVFLIIIGLVMMGFGYWIYYVNFITG
jgi:hypothetical protein